MLLGSPQQLHIAGVMEFWRNRGIGTNAGDKDAGGNVLVDDQIRKNWTYDCGELFGGHGIYALFRADWSPVGKASLYG